MTTKLTIADFAAEYAEKAHGNQLRKDGRLYFTHPQRVAQLVRAYKGNSHEIESLVAAAYCHDLLEDTSIRYYDLIAAFGYCVASLVLEVTTNKSMKNAVGSKKEYLACKLEQLSSWALVIKLCDRLDNISDMNGCTEEWQRKYIEETIYILDYIEAHRELTATHIHIINDIVFEINRHPFKK